MHGCAQLKRLDSRLQASWRPRPFLKAKRAERPCGAMVAPRMRRPPPPSKGLRPTNKADLPRIQRHPDPLDLGSPSHSAIGAARRVSNRCVYCPMTRGQSLLQAHATRLHAPHRRALPSAAGSNPPWHAPPKLRGPLRPWCGLVRACRLGERSVPGGRWRVESKPRSIGVA
jgi:hypothetical protein